MFTFEPYFFSQIICFNTVMHIHTVTLKSHWVEKGKEKKNQTKKRQFLHPDGSVPRVERVATERQAVGGGGDRLGEGEVY